MSRSDERARAEVHAWREIYDLHAPVVRRACGAFAQFGAADVEELVQETFVLAFERIGGLREAQSLRPWLLAIARSRALKRLRGHAVERRALEAFFVDPVSRTVPPLPGEEERGRRVAAVRALIEGLPPGAERETVELFYLDGTLSAREIAERLGVGKSAITMRLERFRARVKQRLAALVAESEEAS